jgi:hypothetical protein
MNYLVLNFVNLVLCFMWGWSAMSRLAMMHGEVIYRIQALYLFIFVSSFFCGAQFFIFGTYAGLPDVMGSSVILSLMWAGGLRWKDGPPDDVVSAPAPLNMESRF